MSDLRDPFEEEAEGLVEFLEGQDDFPQCCFCEHTWLSRCCLNCPVRDEPMLDNPPECRCKKKEN